MNWSLRCDGSSKPFASVGLDAVARGWIFAVPPGCAAQWLELSGTSADISQQAEVIVSNLKLGAVRPNG